jgi:hypothetical protein
VFLILLMHGANMKVNNQFSFSSIIFNDTVSSNDYVASVIDQ